MSFADNLVYLRQHYGVTQEGLAEQLGVSRQTVVQMGSRHELSRDGQAAGALRPVPHEPRRSHARQRARGAQENDTERYDRHMNRFEPIDSARRGVHSRGRGRASRSSTPWTDWPNNFSGRRVPGVRRGGVVVALIVGSLQPRRVQAPQPRHRAALPRRRARPLRPPLPPASSRAAWVSFCMAVIFLVGALARRHAYAQSGSAAYIWKSCCCCAVHARPSPSPWARIIWACHAEVEVRPVRAHLHRAPPRALAPTCRPTAVVKSPEQVRAERVMGVACGVIMLLALIVFLVWGFVPLFDQVGGWDGLDKHALKDAVRAGQGGFAVSWIAFRRGRHPVRHRVPGGQRGLQVAGRLDSRGASQEDAWLKYAQSDAKEDPWARGPEQQESSPDRPAWK